MSTYWFVIFSLGIVQGLFLIITILLLKSKRRVSIHLLTILILCNISLITLQLLKFELNEIQIIQMYKLGGNIPLIMGPLFLFYIMSVVNPGFKIHRNLLLHFIPFIGALLYFFFSDSNILYISSVFIIGKGLHTFIYYGYSWVYLKKKSKLLTQRKKKWFNAKLLSRFILLQILALVVIYLIVAIETVYPAMHIESDSISSLIITFCFFAFAFVIILYPNETLPEKNSKSQYSFSSLTKKQKQKILSSLLKILEEEKAFLNPDLNLKELADQLEMNPNYLSQVINELLEKNFNQLINKYRVEEVKKNITDESRTLLGIAYDCGFNSKSVFNRIFKEVEGKTPSVYKKDILK